MFAASSALSERQLQSWERQDLIPRGEHVHLFRSDRRPDTGQAAREHGYRRRQIARALESLREKLDWMKQPLRELRIVSDGTEASRCTWPARRWRRSAARSCSISMPPNWAASGAFPSAGPVSRAARIGGLVSEGPGTGGNRRARRRGHRGLPEGAGIQSRGRRRAGQSGHHLLPPAPVRRSRERTIGAIEADPGYPLAQFNLGNLYDEQGRLNEAYACYGRAGVQPALCRCALQPGAALRAPGRRAEGGAPLESVSEAGQHGPLGRHSPAPVGKLAASGDPDALTRLKPRPCYPK